MATQVVLPRTHRLAPCRGGCPRHRRTVLRLSNEKATRACISMTPVGGTGGLSSFALPSLLSCAAVGNSEHCHQERARSPFPSRWACLSSHLGTSPARAWEKQGTGEIQSMRS